jgi:hypothetical protein
VLIRVNPWTKSFRKEALSDNPCKSVDKRKSSARKPLRVHSWTKKLPKQTRRCTPIDLNPKRPFASGLSYLRTPEPY